MRFVALFCAILLFHGTSQAARLPRDRAKDFFYNNVEKARNGDVQAKFELGNCYAKGRGVPQDLVKSAAWYGEAAGQGHPGAQNSLALCYLNGTGVPKDYAQAIFWLKSASDQFNEGAQINLGLCYFNGTGVDKNEVEAYAYYCLAGVSGELSREKISFMEKRLSKDELSAGNLRSVQLRKEIQNKADAQAVARYRKAAERGDSLSQGYLAGCYAVGKGVPKDLVEAYAYYNLAGPANDEARRSLATLETQLSSEEIAAGQKRTRILQNEIAARMASGAAAK
jgi:TPR repeat protein